MFDESLELLRLLLREETVSFTGQYVSVDGAGVGPTSDMNQLDATGPAE